MVRSGVLHRRLSAGRIQAARRSGPFVCNAEIQVGIINVEASPYFYGITPTEIQLVAPAFIDAYRRAEKEGYDAVVPLGMLDLGVDGGRSAVDIPVVGPMEACLHVAALLGDRFGLIIYHEKLLAFNRAIVRRYGMENRVVGFGVERLRLARLGCAPRRSRAELRQRSETADQPWRRSDHPRWASASARCISIQNGCKSNSACRS